jgi:hypothetical protein
MVGNPTASIAYGSLVIFDDVDGDGTLGLAAPHPTPAKGEAPLDVTDSPDVIYGASFITMTAPDERVAFREGDFDETSLFYPRRGCPDPRPGFSVVGASGFSVPASFLLVGHLPSEDPAGCTDEAPEAAVVHIPVRPPATVQQVGCDARDEQGETTYLEPPAMKPDFTGRLTTCGTVPVSNLTPALGPVQLVVSGRATDRCKGLTHYVLRGCYSGRGCSSPNWDDTATPPDWWPCPRAPQ